jgi:hypothetical protein
VVTGDAITRRRVSGFETHFFIGYGRMGSFVGTMSLFAHATRGTLDLLCRDM